MYKMKKIVLFTCVVMCIYFTTQAQVNATTQTVANDTLNALPAVETAVSTTAAATTATATATAVTTKANYEAEILKAEKARQQAEEKLAKQEAQAACTAGGRSHLRIQSPVAPVCMVLRYS